MKNGLAYIHECFICETEYLGRHNKLPVGWFIPWDYPVKICDYCRMLWFKKYGTLPAMLRDGNEENGQTT